LPLEPLHLARNGTKADVYLGEWNGQRVVVKDLKRRALWFRVLAGRYFLRREWQVLHALRGTPGVPGVVARPDADSIVIEWCPGRPAKDFTTGELPAGTVERVGEIIDGLHARGVTHGDLHHDNILVADDGSVTLIDWATASRFGPRPSGPKAWSFTEWAALDNRAVAKLKVLHAPELITEAEGAALLGGSSPLYRNIKKLRSLSEKLRGRQRTPTVLNKYKKLIEENSEPKDSLNGN